jgi:mRNA interferase HigB
MKYADSEQQLKSWYQEADKAAWKGPIHFKKAYPFASILPENRVVFNIKGNHYRLVVKINYHYQMVWIRFIGTYAQYDKIDATKI